MRLLLIANDYPNPLEPTKGIFNHHLARALAREHEVHVVSPISWVDEFQAGRRAAQGLGRHRTLDLDGVSVYHPRYYYPPKVLRNHYGSFYWHSIRHPVRRLVETRPPDAVIGYWAHPDGEAAVRIARHLGVRSSVIVGGSDVLLLARHRGRRERILNVLRTADSVVAVSSDLRERIVGLGIPGEKVHLWKRGVDVDLFAPGDQVAARRRIGIPTTGRSLVWVGRMVPVKGLDVLLDACTILRRRATDFRLYLVGDGPLRVSLETAVETRGLSETVTFVGARPHDRLPDWFRAADLTVLPSRSEGLPNVLRESLACGTPFVASRVGGIPEIAEEGSSLLAAPGDPQALAEAIAFALAEWGPSSRPRIRSTSWAESAETLLRIIRSVAPASPSIGAPHAFASHS